MRALAEHGAVLGNALHSAAGANQTDTVRWLLETAAFPPNEATAGRDDTAITVDTTDAAGRTALHIASHAGATEAVRVLCEAGAEVETTTPQSAPACAACTNDHPETLTVLMEFGATPTPAPLEVSQPAFRLLIPAL